MIPPELDDAAFRVVQLDPGAHDDIKSLRDALRQFAVFDEHATTQVRGLVQHAATQLNLILLGDATDAEALLAAAGEAIEQAIQIADRTSAPGRTTATATEEMPVVRDAGDATAFDAAMETPAEAVPAAAPAPSSSATPVRAIVVAVDGGTLPDDIDQSLLRDFIAESRDGLGGAEAALLELEANPSDLEAINTVFRAFHTVKGTAAFMGLDRLADFAHHAESLLSRVRDREVSYTQAVANLSLRSSDVLGEFLDAVEQALQSGETICLPQAYPALMHDLLNVDEVLKRTPAELVALAAESVERAVAAAPAVAAPAVAAPGVSAPVGTAPVVTAPVVRAASAAKPKSESDLSVRVRTDRLDRLIDMVGELVIAQSMIAADPAVVSSGQHDLVKKVTHAGKIMRELQDLSMSMRMVPLRPTFQKLTRLVRDVALKAGKSVELVTDGDETELDRNMVDVLGDPLVHMVRNAVDHGIEPPDVREAAGKPRTGRLSLAAFQQGGSVIVELRDDGRGLNRDRILAKAIEKGLVAPNQSLTDSEINALIFAAGFSTAETLTDISGRGVGMDVVRRNIESIRGRIDIQSVLGAGTTFQIRLPLTLAVTDGMLIRVGEERYIVPLTSISLSFRPEASMITTIPPNMEVVTLRGDVMPVIRLHEVFGIPNAITTPEEAIMMIVSDGEHRIALLVDQLLGQHQVVAKTLGDGVGEVPGIAGGAILSDGHVGLIIDISRLIGLSRTTASRVAVASAA